MTPPPVTSLRTGYHSGGRYYTPGGWGSRPRSSKPDQHCFAGGHLDVGNAVLDLDFLAVFVADAFDLAAAALVRPLAAAVGDGARVGASALGAAEAVDLDGVLTAADVNADGEDGPRGARRRPVPVVQVGDGDAPGAAVLVRGVRRQVRVRAGVRVELRDLCLARRADEVRDERLRVEVGEDLRPVLATGSHRL